MGTEQLLAMQAGNKKRLGHGALLMTAQGFVENSEQQEKKENRSEEENKSFSVNQREQYGPKKTVTFTPPFSDHFPVALGTRESRLPPN